MSEHELPDDGPSDADLLADALDLIEQGLDRGEATGWTDDDRVMAAVILEKLNPLMRVVADETGDDELRRHANRFKSAAFVDVIRAHLDAIGRFVDAFAAVDLRDTSPEERARLVIGSEYLRRALGMFSPDEGEDS
jgi:hypothetical protein